MAFSQDLLKQAYKDRANYQRLRSKQNYQDSAKELQKLQQAYVYLQQNYSLALQDIQAGSKASCKRSSDSDSILDFDDDDSILDFNDGESMLDLEDDDGDSILDFDEEIDLEELFEPFFLRLKKYGLWGTASQRKLKWLLIFTLLAVVIQWALF